MQLNAYQQELLGNLLSGFLTKIQFTQLRSNARRYDNLQRSIELAEVFEVYKQRIKDEKG